MAANRVDIAGWFDEGVRQRAHYLIVACDTYDWEDYPIYVGAEDDFYPIYDAHNGQNFLQVMEVYDLRGDKTIQMAEYRAIHLPTRPKPASTERDNG